jgi:hypothetical protein
MPGPAVPPVQDNRVIIGLMIAQLAMEVLTFLLHLLIFGTSRA